MAYFNQEKKKQVAPQIKAVLKKYGVKGSIAVENHSTLVVNIKSGKLDFINAAQKAADAKNGSLFKANYTETGYIQVNRYHDADDHRRVGENEIADFLDELVQAMLGAGWYDRSDIMTDYFDTAYYLSINIGKWNKPYELTV